MAQITSLAFLRHVRSEPSRHLFHYRRGRLVRSGRGLAFWFWPSTTGLVEVPCDDREIPFLFHGRSADFQTTAIQGSVTCRVVEPELLASRIDFTIDLRNGRFKESPLEQLAALLTQKAQQVSDGYVTGHDLRTVLASGVSAIRDQMEAGLLESDELAALGLAVVAIHVASVKSNAELERALQAPTREAIQQLSDEATFHRRALAVEKERAIQENELQSRIELSRRETVLIEQQGANVRKTSEEERASQRILAEGVAERRKLEFTTEAASERILAEAAAARRRLESAAEAEGIEAIEGAKAQAESARMDIYRDLPPHVLVGLAAQEFAGKLQRIERIHIAPESLAPVLGDLVQAGARWLDGHHETGGRR